MKWKRFLKLLPPAFPLLASPNSLCSARPLISLPRAFGRGGQCLLRSCFCFVHLFLQRQCRGAAYSGSKSTEGSTQLAMEAARRSPAVFTKLVKLFFISLLRESSKTLRRCHSAANGQTSPRLCEGLRGREAPWSAEEKPKVCRGRVFLANRRRRTRSALCNRDCRAVGLFFDLVEVPVLIAAVVVGVLDDGCAVER